MPTPSIRIRALACAGALALLAACQTTPPQPLNIEETQQVTATVEKIDVAKRLLTLRDESGAEFTVQVDPAVRNLPQVQVGDHVVAEYRVAVAAAIVARGQPIGAPSATMSADLARPGDRPGATVGTTTNMSVTITAVDTKNNMVTFYGVDGLIRALTVQTPQAREFIKQLKPGDNVDVTFTEAFAVSVKPAK